LKAFATNEKQSAPALRKVRPYVHHPREAVQQVQQTEIRRILRATGAQAKELVQRQIEPEEEKGSSTSKNATSGGSAPNADTRSEQHHRIPLPIAGSARLIDQNESRAKRTTALYGHLSRHLNLGATPLTIHANEDARKRTDANGAIGLTEGDHIYLNPSSYDPSTSTGRALLAHELVHQAQRRLPACVGPASSRINDAEDEARAAGHAAASNQAVLTPIHRIPHTAKAAADRNSVAGIPLLKQHDLHKEYWKRIWRVRITDVFYEALSKHPARGAARSRYTQQLRNARTHLSNHVRFVKPYQTRKRSTVPTRQTWAEIAKVSRANASLVRLLQPVRQAGRRRHIRLVSRSTLKRLRGFYFYRWQSHWKNTGSKGCSLTANLMRRVAGVTKQRGQFRAYTSARRKSVFWTTWFTSALGTTSGGHTLTRGSRLYDGRFDNYTLKYSGWRLKSLALKIIKSIDAGRSVHARVLTAWIHVRNSGVPKEMHSVVIYNYEATPNKINPTKLKLDFKDPDGAKVGKGMILDISAKKFEYDPGCSKGWWRVSNSWFYGRRCSAKPWRYQVMSLIF